MEVLRVSANSQPTSVAGALSAVLRDNKHAEMQAVYYLTIWKNIDTMLHICYNMRTKYFLFL
jgi:stage V sporulation protein SpoVS